MARKSLGILVTPRININSYIASTTSYVDTPLEKLVDVVIKSLKEHKLLCIDLIAEDTIELFGIVPVAKTGDAYCFSLGAYNGLSNIANLYSFAIDTNLERIEIGYIEV